LKIIFAYLKKFVVIDSGLYFLQATQRRETEREKCDFRIIRMGTQGDREVANIDWS
jgi:6-phosphogluconate dehydrogenase